MAAKSGVDCSPETEDEADPRKSVQLNTDDTIELMVTESDMLDDEHDTRIPPGGRKRKNDEPAEPARKAKKILTFESPSAVAPDSTTSNQSIEEVPKRQSSPSVGDASIAELELRQRALKAELRREARTEQSRPQSLDCLVADTPSRPSQQNRTYQQIVVSPALLEQLASGRVSDHANPLILDSRAIDHALDTNDSRMEAAVRVGLHTVSVSSTTSVVPSKISTKRLVAEPTVDEDRPSLDELRLRERALKSMIVAQAKQKKLI